MFWIKKNKEEKPKVSNVYLEDFYVYLSSIIKIFSEDYGFKRSCEIGLPVDRNGNALPLYTYPSIEYLNSLDFNNKKIFEFGSGQSTIYWLEKGAQVTSVENNNEWEEKLKPQLKKFSNHQYLIKTKQEYIDSILEFPDQNFDIIIIDGAENRNLCAQNSIKKIKEDGIIILDNSDWYPNTAAFLKEKLNFIQIDFYGFRPSKHNTAVTSIFFSRNFNLKPKNSRQPNFSLGGFQQISSQD